MSEVTATVATQHGLAATGPVRAEKPQAEEGTAGLPELRLVRALPGFPDLTRFALVRIDHAEDAGHAQSVRDDTSLAGADAEADPAGSLLFELRCIQAPDVRFLVAAPAAFFPDYTVELDEAAVTDLGLERAEDALILVILTVGSDSASTTANLLAPVVVNARTRSAVQVILSGTDWPVRATVA